MDEQLKEQARLLDRKLEEQSRSFAKKFDENDKKIEEMMKLMREMLANRASNSGRDENARNSQERTDSNPNSGNQLVRPLGYTPKVEFSKFNGTNARNWVKKCVKYFLLCKIPEEQKVDLASLHMLEKAEVWVSNYLSIKKNVDWTEFVMDLSARFKDDSSLNVVEHFNKFQQTGSIEDYIDEFDNSRSLMEQNHHVLPDLYLLESFIGGLKPAVKPFVKAFKPISVTEAINYARLQEESLQANAQRFTKGPNTSTVQKTVGPTVYSTYTDNSHKPPLLPTPQTKPLPSPASKSSGRPFKFIPADVRAEKIAKGLCYYCDNKYEKGHKCQFKEPQLFTVEIPCVDLDSSDSDTESGEVENGDPCISVNALSGSPSFSSMRVKGMVIDKSLHILIDSGSTHNFLDSQTAKDMNCVIEELAAHTITVADGTHIQCQGVVRNFSWKLSGQVFTADVLLISLGSCDMVLGIQWLSTLGSIKWDFQKLIMEFKWADQSVKLKGIAPTKVKVVKTCSDKLLNNAAQLCLIQVKELKQEQVDNSEEHQEEVASDSDISLLKQKYADIFREPEKLPPSRGIFDHKIPLQTGANPINIRPYRYPLKQRDVIEQTIEEMLGRGIIQNSASPFASPVVLVGKKDGTWRLCVDYRELNK
ncbi:uncharacterized protein LOC108203433 [Daucus carota subsp. sativus]|uniref:uncharacterized protein LOC108203433 n=1 Tax=Daucus carota subsp. sativus TaxID=79200 RepID=UPI0007EFFBCF|nr:PREDICTED: uncharacterized protein LOC108203433 [Daucus carota subsp. sativus]